MWLKDPKTGQKSVTLTLLVITFIIALTKIIFSGAEFKGFILQPFTGGDFAAMIGAVGGLYGFRKFTDKDK